MAESGNIIQRIIKLIFDKDSAKETEKGIDEVAKHTDETFKELAHKIAGYLAVAFLVEKVIEFGHESVEQAIEADKAWAQLKGTIDATGESFDAMSGDLHETAQAFQDATTFSREDFANGLSRLVALTGDVGASLNNMGLVANVAAQFFKGELEPAINLVGKAMNGNVAALQRMGIHAKNAQEALDILNTRSMGRAEQLAHTFAGQITQLGNAWKEFKEEIGKALIGPEGSISLIETLKEGVTHLTEAIEDNQDAIQKWTSLGWSVLATTLSVVYRSIVGIGSVLESALLASIFVVTKALSLLGKAWVAVLDVSGGFLNSVGITTPNLDKVRVKIDEVSSGLGAIAKGAKEAGDEFSELGRKMITGAPLLETTEEGRKKRTGLKTPPPKTTGGAGELTEQQKNIQKAIDEFLKSGEKSEILAQVFGKSFDAVGAEIDRTTKLLSAFVDNGVDPASDDVKALAMQLQFLGESATPVNEAVRDLGLALSQNATMAALGLLDPLEKLTADQKAWQEEIDRLVKEQLPETDAALISARDRVKELDDQISSMKSIQELNKQLDELVINLQDDLSVAAIEGKSNLERLKIEQAGLGKLIEQMVKKDPLNPWLKTLKKNYEDVTGAIKRETDAMDEQSDANKRQTDTVEMLAGAITVAAEGSLHSLAQQKSKQLRLEALEMGIRAGLFAIFGNLPAAGKAAAAALEMGALAIAWGAIAASTGGGGASAGVAATSSGGSATSGGQTLSDTRSTARETSQNMVAPTAEVSIYLMGPGFHALNPAVQKVVYGAQQQAIQRYGPNTKIRVLPETP